MALRDSRHYSMRIGTTCVPCFANKHMNIVIRRNKTIKRRLIRLYSLCSVRLVTCFHRCIGKLYHHFCQSPNLRCCVRFILMFVHVYIYPQFHEILYSYICMDVYIDHKFHKIVYSYICINYKCNTSVRTIN